MTNIMINGIKICKTESTFCRKCNGNVSVAIIDNDIPYLARLEMHPKTVLCIYMLLHFPELNSIHL